MRSRASILAVLLSAAVLVAVLVVTLRDRAIPLGVPGEWQWTRLGPEVAPSVLALLIGAAAVAIYAGFVAVGYSLLARSVDPLKSRELLAVASLAIAAVAIQFAVQEAAPAGFGLTKWAFAQHATGSSGYFQLARTDLMDDMPKFLAEYPTWIRDQDALHIGTHPPGLFIAWRIMLQSAHALPDQGRAVVQVLPDSVKRGLRQIERYDPLPLPDRAALGMMGFASLLASALTVAPLFALARASGNTPASAWTLAALWPLVPSAILFQPATDVFYPLIATTALAFAARASYRSAVASGVVLALGMQASLVFLAVGLIAAILLLASSPYPIRHRLALVVTVGAGFLAATLAFWAATRANPFVTWYWNQRNHARFYEQFHRSYARWQLFNLCDVLVGVGLAVWAWALIGLARPRASVLAWSAIAVMAVLQLTGRSLSEVARLWLPLFPPILLAAGRGLDVLGARSSARGVTVALLGIQTLAMQALIQVVYAVEV